MIYIPSVDISIVMLNPLYPYTVSILKCLIVFGDYKISNEQREVLSISLIVNTVVNLVYRIMEISIYYWYIFKKSLHKLLLIYRYRLQLPCSRWKYSAIRSYGAEVSSTCGGSWQSVFISSCPFHQNRAIVFSLGVIARD